MCGFVGYFSFDAKPSSSTVLQSMMDAQKHRGPDDSGMRMFSLRNQTTYAINKSKHNPDLNEVFEGCIGFNRLSVLDLSKDGHQPMANNDETIFIAFNGEIYNAFSYKKELIQAGYKFKSKTDTEVILYLYQHYGLKVMLEMLNGMFSLCIVDLNKAKIYIARDHFGIKPLYFYANDKIIMFSSEVKSFYKHPLFKAELEESNLDEYLMFRYCSGNNFLLKNVQQIKPGFLMEISSNSWEIEQYWEIPDSTIPESKSRKDHFLNLDNILTKAVETQLLSDVELGTQLSGGIDSSLITSYASKKINTELESFSIVFKDELVSEDKWISKAAAATGVHSHRYMFKANDLIKLFEKATWHLDQPLNLPNSLGIYMLAENSKELVTVLLSGEGADEVFGGYSRYYDAKLRNQVEPWMIIFKYIPWLKNRLDKKFNFNSSQDDAFIKASSVLNERDLKDLLPNSNFDRALQSRRKRLSKIQGKGVKRFLKYDMETYMVDLLVRQDKMTMAHSIENRVPYLDRELVNYARSLPEELLVSGFKLSGVNKATKIALKEIASKYFNEDFVYRKKSGFPLPLEFFFKTPEFIAYMEEIILPGLEKRKIFNNILINDWWAKSKQSNKTKQNFSKKLWVVIAFEIWAQIFIDGSGAYPQ